MTGARGWGRRGEGSDRGSEPLHQVNVKARRGARAMPIRVDAPYNTYEPKGTPLCSSQSHGWMMNVTAPRRQYHHGTCGAHDRYAMPSSRACKRPIETQLRLRGAHRAGASEATAGGSLGRNDARRASSPEPQTSETPFEKKKSGGRYHPRERPSLGPFITNGPARPPEVCWGRERRAGKPHGWLL